MAIVVYQQAYTRINKQYICVTVQDIVVVYLGGVNMFCYFRQRDVNLLFTYYNKYILITIYFLFYSEKSVMQVARRQR